MNGRVSLQRYYSFAAKGSIKSKNESDLVRLSEKERALGLVSLNLPMARGICYQDHGRSKQGLLYEIAQ